MIAHGMLAALTFGLSGYLRNAAGTLNMDELGGLLRRLPFVGTAMIMALAGRLRSSRLCQFCRRNLGDVWGVEAPLGFAHRVVAAAAWGGLVIGAIYMLRAVRNIWHGESSRPLEGLLIPEANAWRRLPFVLLLAGLLFFGFFPGVLANRSKPARQAS
jgi:NADH-quinone oxidoreductase subunit M